LDNLGNPLDFDITSIKEVQLVETIITESTSSEFQEILIHKSGKNAKKILNLMFSKFSDYSNRRLMNLLAEHLEPSDVTGIIESDPNLKLNFRLACIQNDEKIVEIFWNFISFYVSDKILKEFLTHAPYFLKFSTLHYSFKFSNINFSKLFTNEELKKILFTKHNENETILFPFYKNDKLNENFANLLFKIFDENELKDYLDQRNAFGYSAFCQDGKFDAIKYNKNVPNNLINFIFKNFKDKELFEAKITKKAGFKWF